MRSMNNDETKRKKEEKTLTTQTQIMIDKHEYTWANTVIETYCHCATVELTVDCVIHHTNLIDQKKNI